MVRFFAVDELCHVTGIRHMILWNYTGYHKKAIFLEVISKFIICRLFKNFTNSRKKTGMVVVSSYRPFLNILKHNDHKRDSSTIWEAKLLQTQFEKNCWYVRNLVLRVGQNCHWNKNKLKWRALFFGALFWLIINHWLINSFTLFDWCLENNFNKHLNYYFVTYKLLLLFYKYLFYGEGTRENPK